MAKAKTNPAFIEDLKSILHINGIRYRFNPRTRMSYADCDKEQVEIGTMEFKPSQIASSVFHEMAHIILFREKRYYVYHTSKIPLTKRVAEIKLRTGLRAERATDRLAAELMQLYFPQMKYTAGYSQKRVVHWFKSEYLKDFRRVARNP